MGELKDKMIKKLKVGGYSKRTQDLYVRQMERFVKFHGVSPDKLSIEDIFAYQVYLVDELKVKWSTFNIAVCSIRFFYNKTLGMNWLIKHIPYQKKDLNFQPY